MEQILWLFAQPYHSDYPSSDWMNAPTFSLVISVSPSPCKRGKYASAFYENLPDDAAFALAQQFEFYYTPESASWLNMIENEFSALARLSLNRRIPTIKQLESELIAIIVEQTAKRIKINWQFSIAVARKKQNSRYSIVNWLIPSLKKIRLFRLHCTLSVEEEI